MKSRTGFSDSALEAMKWLALVAMTVDHVNTVLFDREHAWMFAVGRLAFPLFAFVLGVNLARPTTSKPWAMRRLLLWGCIAQPLHAWAFGSALPLNVLFTFVVAVAVIRLWETRREGWAVLVFAVLPLMVDYQWMGVACVLAAYAWARSPGFNGAVFMVLALTSLTLVNGSFWQWTAVPVIASFAFWTWHVPRIRWAFYGYYVAHFAWLATIASINFQALRS